MSKPAPTLADLEARISIAPNGCWLWEGSLTNHGYGQFRHGLYVHRLIYELKVGPIPPGLHIDHLCRQRRCCNPEHLEPVTPRENLMRSPNTWAARNAAKTHCPAGHPLSGENLYRSGGKRFCRECRLSNTRRHLAKLKRQRAEARARRQSQSNPIQREVNHEHAY